MAAAAKLHQVQQGTLTLASKAVDLIPGWGGTGVQNDVTLRHALAFISECAAGDRPWSYAADQAAYETAVAALPTLVPVQAPGTNHDYDTDHQDISGLMVQKAMGVADWKAVWDAFVADTGHFSSWTLEGPVYSPARKAEGPISEYADWLVEVLLGTALDGGPLLAEYMSDQVANTVEALAGDPLVIAAVIGEDWHFSFGWWLQNRHSRFVGPAASPYPHMTTFGLQGQYGTVDLDDGFVFISGPNYPDTGAGQSHADTIYWYRERLEGLIKLWVRQGCPS